MYGQYNPMPRPNIGTRTPFRTVLDEKRSPWEDLTLAREKEMEEIELEEDNSFLNNLKALQGRGQGPADSEYGRFLAEGMPRREDYQAGTGRRIAAALLSGVAGYQGNQGAIRDISESMDRPYNEAVEQYGMRGKILGEQAEREQSHYENELAAAESLARYGNEAEKEKRLERRQADLYAQAQAREEGLYTRNQEDNISLEKRREAQDAAALARTIQGDKDRAAERALDRSAAASNVQAIIAGQNHRDATPNPVADKTSYTDLSKAKTDARNILLNSPDWIWLKDNLDQTALAEGVLTPLKDDNKYSKSGGKQSERAAHLQRFEQAVEDKAQELLGGRKPTKSAAPKYIKDKYGNYILNPNYGK